MPLPTFLRPLHRRVLPALLAITALISPLSGCSKQEPPLSNETQTFEGQGFLIVRIDLHREALTLHWHNPDTHQPFGDIPTLLQWGQDHDKRLLFAANAGIYDQAFAPLGLFVENGKTLVPLNMSHGKPTSGNFSLLPNGVFAIYPDGHAAVRVSADFKTDAKQPQWATQSGPMLVIDGQLNQQFVDDSSSLKWRSGVCARTPYDVVFVVSESPVNFHTFARLFKESLHCRDALYLDGTISQFYLDGAGYTGAPTFLVKPYAGIFAVFAQP